MLLGGRQLGLGQSFEKQIPGIILDLPGARTLGWWEVPSMSPNICRTLSETDLLPLLDANSPFSWIGRE